MINDRLIDAGDLPIAVRDFGGDRPPLMLLHGGGSNLASMTTLARQLRPRHRVVAMDLRGHGRSGDGPWSWDAALGDLAAVAVQLDLDRPAVVGHSLGGMLAALWAQRHPESGGAVSLDGSPPPSRIDQLPGLEPERAVDELAKLMTHFDGVQTGTGQAIGAEQLADMIEAQRMTARELGADEKVWIESFRRNLVQQNGETTLRPSAGTTSQLRTLMEDLDVGPVYAATASPFLLVLATRELPQQEPFAELYAAHRSYLLDQAETAARANPKMRYLRLDNASPAMVAEQPQALAKLIGDFLT